jgi:hypothetical protein
MSSSDNIVVPGKLVKNMWNVFCISFVCLCAMVSRQITTLVNDFM